METESRLHGQTNTKYVSPSSMWCWFLLVGLRFNPHFAYVNFINTHVRVLWCSLTHASLHYLACVSCVCPSLMYGLIIPHVWVLCMSLTCMWSHYPACVSCVCPSHVRVPFTSHVCIVVGVVSMLVFVYWAVTPLLGYQNKITLVHF